METKVLLQEVNIIIKGDLTAGELGEFLQHISKMYLVVQDYLDSDHDLQVLSVSKGSYIFQFLVDSTVWNSMVDLWQLVGGNALWDAIKLFPVVAFNARKEMKSTNNDMSNVEVDTFVTSAEHLAIMALRNKCDIQIDYGKEVITIIHGKQEQELNHKEDSKNSIPNYFKSFINENMKVHIIKEPFADDEKNIGKLPPRNTIHKKRNFWEK